jgi:hypothetical protein
MIPALERQLYANFPATFKMLALRVLHELKDAAFGIVIGAGPTLMAKNDEERSAVQHNVPFLDTVLGLELSNGEPAARCVVAAPIYNNPVK